MKRFFAALIAVMLMLTAVAGCSAKETEYPVAFKVGEKEFTVSDMNYMYMSTFNEIYYNLYSYYGSSISYIVDLSKPLEEQMISADKSWHDYLIESTESSVKSIVAVYDAAKAAGFVLPEDYQKDIDTIDEQLSEIAAENDMIVEEYVKSSYGEDTTVESIKKMTEYQLYCNAYVQDYKDKIEVTDEDILAYYEANKKDIDTVNFRYYSSYYAEETAEGTENSEETEVTLTKDEAKAQADALAAAKNADEFNALAKEYTTDESQKELFEIGDATLFAGASYSATGIEEVSEWLFDEARVAGDTMVHHDETYSSYLTVMFEERVDPDYDYIDVRHILIAPEEGEDGEVSDEAWAAAEEKAKEVYDSYLAGEQTEDAFAALAVEHSADGNAAQGGIYENVAKGKMVQPFNDWCFDEARKTGDSDIVKTQFGYHVMYFVGIGDNNLVSVIEPTVQQEKLYAFVADCEMNVTTEATDEMENVGGMIDELVAASSSSDEKTEGTVSTSAVIIAVLVAIIIVCIIIIIKNAPKKKSEPSEDTEEPSEDEECVLEATDDDLTDEEIVAEEAFEENASEETTEETEEENTEE